jgi:hypothetical protein
MILAAFAEYVLRIDPNQQSLGTLEVAAFRARENSLGGHELPLERFGEGDLGYPVQGCSDLIDLGGDMFNGRECDPGPPDNLPLLAERWHRDQCVLDHPKVEVRLDAPDRQRTDTVIVRLEEQANEGLE